MIEIITYIVFSIYLLALLLILFYSLAQLNLLINYLRSSKQQIKAPVFDFNDSSQIPLITIQLPIYNEAYVVERLLDNIVKMDYPLDKLEIQVLDDSTDSSLEKTANKIDQLQSKGLDIVHILRDNRAGFKAGALKEGLAVCKGEYIAIFDADFLPKPDWLRKTVPFFKDDSIGVVQTRWGHINRDYSILTRIQAFALDAHFTIEQGGRNARGHFINFNGTAGIWRKACILDAGNWEGDTLTEDLDLSYRAQLKKWKFKYLEKVETPAELPVVLSAARSQQFRWNKGGAENFRKSLPKLLSSKNIPLKTKIHGILHLLNSSMFLCAFLVAILSIPVLYLKQQPSFPKWIFDASVVFLLSTLILFVCYWFTYKQLRGNNVKNFFGYCALFIAFFTVLLGFTLHNSFAVLQGHYGKRTDFVRTPKFNINSLKDQWKGNTYISGKISKSVVLEALLLLYFLFGILSAFVLKDYSLLAFHIMLFFGFSFVLFHSVNFKS
ncbi:cellulose synthase family protein [Galbibacter sp.]|uniref:cellulose synthase family protein n=1 Tax=Galbibacter sp. TaxID=2918471 RepID=UPI003A91075D